MTEQEYLACATAKKTKVKKFNNLPFEERTKIVYYNEKARVRGMKQVLDALKNDIGSNQKRKINKWVNDIEKSLESEYEVIE